jgi:hypothetical protein
MKAHIRLAVFLASAVTGLAVAPIRAAEAVLPAPRPRIALGSDAAWSLRKPVDQADRKRAVRIVYQPLLAER